jgi:hypothetical protein
MLDIHQGIQIERHRRTVMSTLMTSLRIRRENRSFGGTGGLSQNNRGAGFLPAFRDLETGRVELSRLDDGMVAPVHLLGGLPEDWVVTRNAAGGVAAIKATVVAGFLRKGRFYTREEAAHACAH